MRKLRLRNIKCLAPVDPTSISPRVVWFYRTPQPLCSTCLRFEKDLKSESVAHTAISHSPPSFGSYRERCDNLSEFTLGDSGEKTHLPSTLTKATEWSSETRKTKGKMADTQSGCQEHILHNSENSPPPPKDVQAIFTSRASSSTGFVSGWVYTPLKRPEGLWL